MQDFGSFRWPVLAIGAIGCVVLSGCVSSPAGHYVGAVVPQPAVPGARCGEPTQGLLTIQGDRFAFAPSEGVLVIPGTVSPDGTLHGEVAIQGARTGADMGAPGHVKAAPSETTPMTFDGKLSGSRVTGTLTSPRCRSSASLDKS